MTFLSVQKRRPSPTAPISAYRRFPIYSFLIPWLLTLLSGADLAAQGPDNSPRAALNAVFEKGNLMTALSGYQWRPGLNLAAAHLSVGQTISLNVALTKDVEYVFLASGSAERTDVDLYLRDAAGTVLAEDQQDDGTPVIEFKAPKDGIFQLQLHLAAGDLPEAFVALSLLQGRGHQIFEQSYRSITAGFFTAAEEVLSSVPGADWQKHPGEWCLFGCSPQENEGVTLRGLRPLPGQQIFAAAGLEPSEISLYLATEAGRIVAGTDRPEAFPLLSYQCPPNSVLDLRIEAERSKAHILVLIGVFHE